MKNLNVLAISCFKLARLHRPVGILLLFWPCSWAFALSPRPASLTLLSLFILGAVLMRSAGCVYNDLVDAPLDAQVARTKTRPLAVGMLSRTKALIWLGILLLGAANLLWFLPYPVIHLSFIALGLVFLYPWMKRITYWPQLFLGIVFGGWGTLMTWVATETPLTPTLLYLFIAATAWVVGYDTIYAYQDRQDDILVGIKSTAVRFSGQAKAFLGFWYGLMMLCLVMVGIESSFSRWWYVSGLSIALIQLLWQIVTLDINNPTNCQQRFLSNMYLGGYLGMLFWGAQYIKAL